MGYRKICSKSGAKRHQGKEERFSQRAVTSTVQAENSAEARRVVMQIIPGATVTGAHRVPPSNGYLGSKRRDATQHGFAELDSACHLEDRIPALAQYRKQNNEGHQCYTTLLRRSKVRISRREPDPRYVEIAVIGL